MVTFFLCNFFSFYKPSPALAQYEDCACCSVYQYDEYSENGTSSFSSGLTCEDIRARCPFKCPGLGTPEDSGCDVEIEISYTRYMCIRRFRILPLSSCDSISSDWYVDDPCLKIGDTCPEVNWDTTSGGTATASFTNLQCKDKNGCVWYCMHYLYPRNPPDLKSFLQCLLDGLEKEFEGGGKGQSGKLTCS